MPASEKQQQQKYPGNIPLHHESHERKIELYGKIEEKGFGVGVV